jgi:hypothetical protein
MIEKTDHLTSMTPTEVFEQLHKLNTQELNNKLKIEVKQLQILLTKNDLLVSI